MEQVSDDIDRFCVLGRGDTNVFINRSLESLKEEYPDCVVFWVTREQCERIVRMGNVDVEYARQIWRSLV